MDAGDDGSESWGEADYVTPSMLSALLLRVRGEAGGYEAFRNWPARGYQTNVGEDPGRFTHQRATADAISHLF